MEPESEGWINRLFDSILILDRFEIKAHLTRFSSTFLQNEDTEKLRLILKKIILEEVLKEPTVEEYFYQTCLNETNAALALGGTPVNSGYACCLVGCRFTGQRHRLYMIHLKRNHPNIRQVNCNFQKICRRTFTSVDALISHVRESHSVRQPEVALPLANPISVPCRCNRLSCGGLNFGSTNQLMTHWNTFHSSEPRDCIFKDCSKTFSQSSMSRNHFRLKHKHTGNMVLKQRHLHPNMPAPHVPDVAEFQDFGPSHHEVEPVAEVEEYDDVNLMAIENPEPDQLDEDYYLQYYSDFLNRLSNFKFVAMSTVQEISEEYMMNTKKSLENRKCIMR